MKNDNELSGIDYWTKEDWEKLVMHLKRRKGDYLKAQYLRSVAYEMIHDVDSEKKQKGISLMKKMTELYPNEYLITMSGYSCLGKYYRLIGDYENSVHYYKKILEFNHSDISNGKYDIPEMQIALTIITLNRTEEFEYGKTLLSEINPKTLFVQKFIKLYNLMNSFFDGFVSRDEVVSYWHNNMD